MFNIGDRVKLNRDTVSHKAGDVGVVVTEIINSHYVDVIFDGCDADSHFYAGPCDGFLLDTVHDWITLVEEQSVTAPAKTICQCSIQDLLWCGHMPDCIEKKR